MFHMKRLGWSPLRVLLNLEALLELAASSIDIVAACLACGRHDTRSHQDFGKLPDSGR